MINNEHLKTSFKAHYTNVDIGASSLNGSLKIRAISDNNDLIANKNVTVFQDGEKRTEDAFEKNLAAAIAQFEKENKEKISKFDRANDMYLTTCYPGPKVQGNENGFKLSNFYYDNSRKERFKSPISPDKIDAYLANTGINLVQSRHVNDMVAAGACILSKIQKECPQILKEGEEILYLYPGGGLGSGFIIVDDDNIKIKSSEIQHIKKSGQNLPLESDIGAFSIVKNFTENFNSMPIEKQKEFGSNVRAVCDYNVANSIYPMSKEEFYTAAFTAFDKFFDALAQIISINICSSSTKNVILTGNIVNGIKKAIDEKAQTKDDLFTQILKSKVFENLTDVGRSILGNNPDNLNIEILELQDNTQGSHLLHGFKEVGTSANWYKFKF